MTRVTLVTGGTRGIGAAISTALKAAGYYVAATYGGNDEAANKFKEETGIPIYKWDVSDFAACQVGVAQVEADLGQSRCWSTTLASPVTARSTRCRRKTGARWFPPTSIRCST